MQASNSLTELQFSAGQRGMIEIPSQRIRDSLGLLFDITPLSTELNSGIHRSRNWYANQCIFTQLEADAFAVRRTKDQIQNGEHLVFVHRYLDGYLRGRIGDLNIDREPGFIYILDQASNVECVQRPAIMQTVIIPKSALGFDPDAHPPLIKFSVEHGLGRVINSLFDSVFDGLLNRNAVEFSDFNQLIACLRLGLGAPEIDDVGDVRTLARQAIQRSIATYVEQKLDRWSLDVSTILKDFGVSRASLYRMFEDRGGVRQYISDRRLLRAVLDISKGPIHRGAISEAAERWGFSSAANFNRAIRREFGVTPGALIALPEDDPQCLMLRKDLRAFREVADESVERIARPKLLVPA
jgi:AraC-like DNA-binding protein